ncbi:MAG: indolepyruvate ferredoxin oxidoreductase subunit beta [Thermoplasmata archaeon]|nr:MAG: indolepyruvate ferredoxin oxidoreductase subunit beta [Thermoplasmata archaeon]RLF64756.1 MAG: indolepyruvate ferredoxin oxidoreductase subunit beta [Thermoplasmata archaeon]
MKIRMIFAGVGGQGVLTEANILAKAFLSAGEKALTSEVHGMAQRGGSVVCTVCAGDVHSPLIADGGADAIVSMEPTEALRYIKKLKEGGTVITDVNPVIPPNVSLGQNEYPDLESVFKEISNRGKLIKIDALEIAKRAGNAITKNIVMLGALSGMEILPIDREKILQVVRENVPAKYVEMNERAFNMGYEAVRD